MTPVKEIIPSSFQPAVGDILYQNAFASESDLALFRLEGEAKLTFPNRRLRMENALDPALGQASNFVLWSPVEFPDQVRFTWDFWPIREPGLCMFFFAANGRQGEDLFAPTLSPRVGLYDQYHHGDINALHLSYFRRKQEIERSFHTCNLRKSYGFHLVAQGADPIPTVADAKPPYHLTLWKNGPRVTFAINDLVILDWHDEKCTGGPALAGGKVGFRQMAPLIGEYANFEVRRMI